MDRIVIDRPGGYDRLQVEEAPDPVPGAGEVLVDVVAVGVNYADCVIRMGLYASAREIVGYPITPGFEVAGTLAALGPGVDGPPPGTPVMAVTLFGGYATRVCVPERQVFALPEGLSVEQAAESLGVTTRTVERDLHFARAWLSREWREGGPGS